MLCIQSRSFLCIYDWLTDKIWQTADVSLRFYAVYSILTDLRLIVFGKVSQFSKRMEVNKKYPDFCPGCLA